jgi:predicted nucleic acid-binding protein
VYVEAAAAAKLLVEEPESAALAVRLDLWVAEGSAILGSLLLETELRRLAHRLSLAQERVSDLLDRFDLLEPDAVTYRTAGLLPGAHLRSLDALHVAAAVQGDCRTLVTYDARQAEAARAAGLQVVSPGA